MHWHPFLEFYSAQGLLVETARLKARASYLELARIVLEQVLALLQAFQSLSAV